MNKILQNLLQYPKTIVIFFLSLSVISIFLVFNFLQVNTSTDDLINKKLKFKIDQDKLKKDFEILDNNILVKISGQKNAVKKNSKLIIEDLKKRDDLSFYYSPSLDEVFKNNFFVFLNDNQKKELISTLYKNQPFISEISNNPRLEGFNNLLSLMLMKENLDENEIVNLVKILKSFKNSSYENELVDWSEIINRNSSDLFIIVGIKKDKLEDSGFSNFYNYLDSLSNKFSSVSINYTGGLVIDYEEISSVANGASKAGFLSLFFVTVILWIAFKNLKAIFFLIISIIIGLTITLGLTTIIVGQLNLISVAFAVLFIGLSVDYGIQIYSRILENKNKLEKNHVILKVKSISNTLLIASVPSMVGFISFIPTNYSGLSELGIISFLGLIVGLLTNLLFFSSLIIIFDCYLKKIKNKKVNLYKSCFSLLYKQKKIIFLFILFVLVFTFINLNKINFDSDALNLKDDSLKSVVLAKQLIEKNPTSDYIISVVLNKKDFNSQDNFKDILSKKSVKSIFSYKNLVDDYNNDELDYFKFLISSQIDESFYSSFEDLNDFKRLLKKVSKIDNANLSSESLLLLDFLEENILTVEEYKKLQQNYFLKFDEMTAVLRNLGKKNDNLVKNLPFFYKERYLSNSEKYRIEIFPSKDVSQKENLSEFVQEVQSVYPDATGMPVVQYYAGNVVINSFIFAMVISLIFLTGFIFFIFRKVKFVLITLSCLFLGALLTIFLMIILKINFNFANMISLPLLFSLGVSYPVYYLRRYIELQSIDLVVDSKTPSAIFLSAMTTICSFSTLAVSSHQGTSSMGILLFISLLMTIISSMFLLPIILSTLKLSIK